MISVCLPSDALSQHLLSYLGFSYLGHGVSLHGCSSKAQPLLLTLDDGYLLTAAPPDLERGVAPLSPTESAPLWSTWKPELELLRPWKCMQPRVCLRQFLQSNPDLRSVAWESTHAVSGGKPSVAKTLWAHASVICLQCSSLPTARLNKWDLKSVRHPPLCQGGNYTLKRPANRRS